MLEEVRLGRIVGPLRAPDLQQLLRVLLAVGHFVDDFAAIEDVPTADSAFQAFDDLFGLLGLQVKPSKAQPPADHGVLFRICPEGVKLSPTPERVATVRASEAAALDSNTLTPAAAEKLAGRLAFLTQAVFGKLGRAALAPIYARAHDPAVDATASLNGGLAAALRAVVGILDHIRPSLCGPPLD